MQGEIKFASSEREMTDRIGNGRLLLQVSRAKTSTHTLTGSMYENTHTHSPFQHMHIAHPH